MPPIYVTGHRNPDLDSIGSAIGYAELKGRVDPDHEYVPVRLGDVNAQTAWVLERAGLEPPELLEHIRLRACDVMRTCGITAHVDDPVREVGLAMAEQEQDIVPVLDGDGSLAGVITERELARMYIRESRGASTFADRPVSVEAMVGALDGTLVSGDPHARVTGRVWVVATDAETTRGLVEEGDIVVVGARPEVHELAIDCGAAVLVTSHGVRIDDALQARAEERGTAVVVSRLDSYVTGRMIQLAVPSSAVMTSEPMAVTPGDVTAEIAERFKDSGLRAGVVIDDKGCPLGVVRRSDLVDPAPRRVILVDHAERGQSAPGIEEASILEILDHHHIGSIETRLPVKATFDPVGSTATLVVERFRREGREPRPATATMLLGALLSDTVILTGPTTTDRDHTVAGYLRELLGVDPAEFGREMFEAGSDVSDVEPEDLVTRDAKAYTGASGRPFWIGQVEVVGSAVLESRAELVGALERVRERRGAALHALMITDIAARGTELLVAGDVAAAERALAAEAHDGAISLPGVMSRKKQVAPRLLAVV